MNLNLFLFKLHQLGLSQEVLLYTRNIYHLEFPLHN